MLRLSIKTSRWSRLLAAALALALALPPRAALALHTLEPTESTTRTALTSGLEEQEPLDPKLRALLSTASRVIGLGAIGLVFGAVGYGGGRELASQTADPTTTTLLTYVPILIPDQPVPTGTRLLRNPNMGPSTVTLHWPVPRSPQQLALRAALEAPDVGRPVPTGYDVLYMEFSTANVRELRIAVSNGLDPWTELVVGTAHLNNTDHEESWSFPVRTSLTNLSGQPSTVQLRFWAAPRDPRHPMELSFGALAKATRWPSPFEQKAAQWGFWGGVSLGTLGMALGAAFGLYSPRFTWRHSRPLAPDELERLQRVCAVVEMARATLLSPEHRVTDPPSGTDAIRQQIQQALGYASDIRTLLLALEQATRSHEGPRLKVQRLAALFDGESEWVLERALERLSAALRSEPAPLDRSGLEESAIVESLVPPLAEALAARGAVTVTALCQENTFRSVTVQLLLQQAARRLEIPWLLATSGGLSTEAIPLPPGVTPQPASREAWMRAPTPIRPLVESGLVDPDLIDAFIPEDHPIHDWQPLVRTADLVLVMEAAHRNTVEQALSEEGRKVRLLADLVPEASPLRAGDDPFVKDHEVPDTSDPKVLVEQMPQAVRPLITALERVHADAVAQTRRFLEEWGQRNGFLPRPGDTWRIDDLSQGFEFEMQRLGRETIPAFVEHAHYAMIAHDSGATTIHLYAPSEFVQETERRFSGSPPRLPQLRFQVHAARELESDPPKLGVPWLLLVPGTGETQLSEATLKSLPQDRILRLEGPLAAYARTAMAAIALDPTIAEQFPLSELRVVAVEFTVGPSRYIAFFV